MTPKQFCALVLFTAFAVPASAGTKIDDPVAFVKGIYTHWQTNRVPPEDIYTDRLKAMFAIDEKKPVTARAVPSTSASGAIARTATSTIPSSKDGM